jgi:hypothetical protein
MAQMIQLALGSLESSLGIQGHTWSLEANEHAQQFGQNASTDIGNSQRLQKEVYA